MCIREGSRAVVRVRAVVKERAQRGREGAGSGEVAKVVVRVGGGCSEARAALRLAQYGRTPAHYAALNGHEAVLRYLGDEREDGAALLHTIAPGPEQGKQQQQAALAFEQAKREGASEEEVMAVQRDVVRQLVVEACGLAAQPAVAISSAERG